MGMVKYPDKRSTVRGKRMTSGRSTRESESVVSELEGALVRQRSAFSYLMLVAFEACGILRFAVLLLAWPLSEMVYHLISEELAVKILIFVAVAGLKVREIESVARAVLPKFYMDDLNSETWRVFSSFGRKVVVTYSPRIMVEPFLKGHLSADEVIGTELEVNRYGRATGFLKVPGVLLGVRKRIAVKALFGDEAPTAGLGPDVGFAEPSFMSLCKERYVVPLKQGQEASTPADEVCKPAPIIFHDGRLVQRPTPSMALLILLWMPLGLALAIFRIISGLILPVSVIHYTTALFGGRIIVRGSPPAATAPSNTTNKTGVLFVCTHRTLMDPVVLSVVLKRRIPAVTYSISRLSEILAPIPTVRLIRDRERDAAKIRRHLQKGDLVVCPEGTTCREPFLLRFSALFAELTDQIVPVAMNYRVSLFHGTTARGLKAMDPFFFFMNPSPTYEVTFLNQLPHELTCSGGKSSHDVANYVQRILAGTLGFQCTQFTRKDKYRILAGNDGIVRSRGSASSSSSFFSAAFTRLLQSIPHS